MNELLFRNIGQLAQVRDTPTSIVAGPDMAELPHIRHAFLWVKDGLIHDFGPMSDCPALNVDTIDASGRLLLPAWCDSHTHLVFAASRESEFVDRIKGLSYQEIAQKGGGILNSARRLNAMPEEELLEHAWQRLQQVQRSGTGAIEIKSGYGLSLEGELKMLRVIRELKSHSPMPIRATFLGAHALPEAYREHRDDYLRLLLQDLLPRIAAEGLADYIDVFCEKNFFSVAESESIMEAGLRYGLKAKIHTNQFNAMGGIQAAVAHRALSVDHLEVLTDEEINCLLLGDTIPTLLPTAPFFLNDHYPPARRIIDAGLPVALATDFNPGSSPSGRMGFAVSLACIKLRMTPQEAINAATINGAAAMELASQCGSIQRGLWANLQLTRPVPSLAYLPYAFGDDLVDKVWIKGIAVTG